MIKEETVQIEKRATKPNWRPASKVATLKARHGFTARWVNSDPGEIAAKKSEGWILMKPEDNLGDYQPLEDVNDGKAIFNGIRFRDMIAMMLPDDMKEAREEYMRRENANAKELILNKTDEEAKRNGVQIYAAKGHSGRIVID